MNGHANESDTSLAWMMRGLMIGVLVIGSANAISFFFLSEGWGSLLGSREFGDEAIGFPLTVWEEGSSYAHHPLRVVPFLINIATGFLIGVAMGSWAIWQKPTLNRIMARFRGSSLGKPVKMQFSLRGLLVTTLLAALAAAIARAFTPRVEVLAAIYALGPISLILLAYAPRGLRWQQRVAVLTPATFVLIAVAITLGNSLDIEFDKVMMGIFICWTPQAAIGAILLTAFLLWREYRALQV